MRHFHALLCSKRVNQIQHDAPKHPQHTPSWYVTPVYSANTQYTMTDETPPLAAQQCLKIQKVTGSAVYYARAVEPTILMPLNDIAKEQTKATRKHRPPQINCYIIWPLTRTPQSDITPPT
jgi:hypothetical protein